MEIIKKIGITMILFMLVGCSNKEKEPIEESQEFFAMDTYMSLGATGVKAKEAIQESEAYIMELEAMISRTDSHSEIYMLNHSNGEIVIVSDITYDIIDTAVQCAEKTDGKFDPTICTMIDLWGIGTENQHVPSTTLIEDALEAVSYKNVVLHENNGVQLLHGAQIDLGAVGKGYAADGVHAIYEKYGIESGIIALGGNLYLIGEKEENIPWNVGIVDPDYPEEYNMGLKVSEQSVVTTGAYERYFEEDGVIYHHIFDTETGYPTRENIKSVTVVSQSSTMADIYATALFAMGYEKAIEFLEVTPEIAGIIIREDNVVFVSEELKDNITMDEKYTIE